MSAGTFLVRYRVGDLGVTLELDHDKADWADVCDAAIKHLGLKHDDAARLRWLRVMAGRRPEPGKTVGDELRRVAG